MDVTVQMFFLLISYLFSDRFYIKELLPTVDVSQIKDRLLFSKGQLPTPRKRRVVFQIELSFQKFSPSIYQPTNRIIRHNVQLYKTPINRVRQRYITSVAVQLSSQEVADNDVIGGHSVRTMPSLCPNSLLTIAPLCRLSAG